MRKEVKPETPVLCMICKHTRQQHTGPNGSCKFNMMGYKKEIGPCDCTQFVEERPVIDLTTREGQLIRKVAEAQMLANQISRYQMILIKDLEEVREMVDRYSIAVGREIGNLEDEAYDAEGIPTPLVGDYKNKPPIKLDYKRKKRGKK